MRHIKRVTVGFVVLVLSMLGLSTGLSAGGWALTTLDGVPDELRAGETYQIGYTIRAHGQTPVAVEDTAIHIQSADKGPIEVFPSRPEGSEGHYVAEVTFPESGQWTWKVTQGSFGEQELGAINVETATAGTALGVLRIILPVAAALAMILLAIQAWPVLHTRGRTAPVDAS